MPPKIQNLCQLKVNVPLLQPSLLPPNALQQLTSLSKNVTKSTKRRRDAFEMGKKKKERSSPTLIEKRNFSKNRKSSRSEQPVSANVNTSLKVSNIQQEYKVLTDSPVSEEDAMETIVTASEDAKKRTESSTKKISSNSLLKPFLVKLQPLENVIASMLNDSISDNHLEPTTPDACVHLEEDLSSKNQNSSVSYDLCYFTDIRLSPTSGGSLVRKSLPPSKQNELSVCKGVTVKKSTSDRSENISPVNSDKPVPSTRDSEHGLQPDVINVDDSKCADIENVKTYSTRSTRSISANKKNNRPKSVSLTEYPNCTKWITTVNIEKYREKHNPLAEVNLDEINVQHEADELPNSQETIIESLQPEAKFLVSENRGSTPAQKVPKVHREAYEGSARRRSSRLSMNDNYSVTTKSTLQAKVNLCEVESPLNNINSPNIEARFVEKQDKYASEHQQTPKAVTIASNQIIRRKSPRLSSDSHHLDDTDKSAHARVNFVKEGSSEDSASTTPQHTTKNQTSEQIVNLCESFPKEHNNCTEQEQPAEEISLKRISPDYINGQTQSPLSNSRDLKQSYNEKNDVSKWLECVEIENTPQQLEHPLEEKQSIQCSGVSGHVTTPTIKSRVISKRLFEDAISHDDEDIKECIIKPSSYLSPSYLYSNDSDNIQRLKTQANKDKKQSKESIVTSKSKKRLRSVSLSEESCQGPVRRRTMSLILLSDKTVDSITLPENKNNNHSIDKSSIDLSSSNLPYSASDYSWRLGSQTNEHEKHTSLQEKKSMVTWNSKKRLRTMSVNEENFEGPLKRRTTSLTFVSGKARESIPLTDQIVVCEPLKYSTGHPNKISEGDDVVAENRIDSQLSNSIPNVPSVISHLKVSENHSPAPSGNPPSVILSSQSVAERKIDEDRESNVEVLSEKDSRLHQTLTNICDDLINATDCVEQQGKSDTSSTVTSESSKNYQKPYEISLQGIVKLSKKVSNSADLTTCTVHLEKLQENDNPLSVVSPPQSARTRKLSYNSADLPTLTAHSRNLPENDKPSPVSPPVQISRTVISSTQLPSSINNLKKHAESDHTWNATSLAQKSSSKKLSHDITCLPNADTPFEKHSSATTKCSQARQFPNGVADLPTASATVPNASMDVHDLPSVVVVQLERLERDLPSFVNLPIKSVSPKQITNKITANVYHDHAYSTSSIKERRTNISEKISKPKEKPKPASKTKRSTKILKTANLKTLSYKMLEQKYNLLVPLKDFVVKCKMLDPLGLKIIKVSQNSTKPSQKHPKEKPGKKLKSKKITSKDRTKKQRKPRVPFHYRGINNPDQISSIKHLKTRYRVAFALWPQKYKSALDKINQRIVTQNVFWNTLT